MTNVPVTKITFTQPLGNIRVDFPLDPECQSYEICWGHAVLTPQQAQEAAGYGWVLTEIYRELSPGLVEVARPMISYQGLVARRGC